MTNATETGTNQKQYPFAVISPELGTRSETFIYRHMTALLPDRTVVVVRRKKQYAADHAISFPHLVLEPAKRDIGWLIQSFKYLFRLNRLSPVQVRVGSFLQQHRVQFVLSQYLDHSLKWLPVAKHLGIRFYAHAHGYDVSKVLRDAAMRARYRELEHADGVITMSEHIRTRLIDIGLSGANIHIIPYGIHIPERLPQKKPRERIRCLAVGRMVGKKAPLVTLEAFRQACMQDTRLGLDYVGDGPFFEDAQAFVRTHGLEDNVTLHGSRPNAVVQELMRQADIFVQHSRTDPDTGDEEGLPVAILEAMANGLPVVSTRHAGIPESVIENETGYLVDEGDVAGMSTHLLQLASDIQMRLEMGRMGRRRAEANYAWETEKASLLKLFDSNGCRRP